MKIIDFIRLIGKHTVLLLITPILMASLVVFLTRNPTYTFSSETTLYTGIASGSSIEMDKSLNYYATNTAFENLINIIKSRETQQEVAIRLLATHLMLDEYDPAFLSKNSYTSLKAITPPYIEKLIAHKKIQSKATRSPLQDTISEAESESSNVRMSNKLKEDDSLRLQLQQLQNSFSFSDLDSSRRLLPKSIDVALYEQTVSNLTAFMTSSDTNFIYKLLNFTNPHYSIKAISAVNVQRMGTSDLVKIKYDSDDPGICRQTLALMTDVCIKNFKDIKENRSDAVVKYFEHQLKQAAIRLKLGEDKLLDFNKDNNIINYYEQSKAVAIVKENLDVDYNNKRIKLAGLLAGIKRIEEKLNNQQQVQLKSSYILEQRNKLSEINTKIATLEIVGGENLNNIDQIAELKSQAKKIEELIRNGVSDLYTYGNSTEGLPVTKLLNDWISNVVDYEDTKAGLKVLGDRIAEFQKQYEIYAPAGANIKRIEREINVSEQEFLELLHGLNLAKLKMQDVELSSSIKAVDPPYFPLSPNPTKRAIFVIVGAFFGFIIVLVTILALEYFDGTLKNATRASKVIGLKSGGVFPKILLKTGGLNFVFIVNRLIEFIVQQIELDSHKVDHRPFTIMLVSSQGKEGKSTLLMNLAVKFKSNGKKVVALNYSTESLKLQEESQMGYPPDFLSNYKPDKKVKQKKFSILGWIFGYPDKRINYNSEFLAPPSEVLSPEEYYIYDINKLYYSSKTVVQLASDTGVKALQDIDILLLEIPAILYYSFPTSLPASADCSLLVCRANREWSDADAKALKTYAGFSTNSPLLVLNGTDVEELESALGELPKKRGFFRRKLKRILQFQFFSRQQI